MLNPPFEDEAFDGVLAIQSLEYIPVKLTHKVLLEIHRILKSSGIALLSLEKTPNEDGMDKEFNYVYEDKYVRVKKHLHRGWGKEGLKIINKMFNVLKLDEDKDYYYIMIMRSQ